ncbi:hypothetical protein TNCV_2861521 [Trichonephila clavipes]|nr:hypothetical protein TNCV_2861521 [Trichonephila clavipes]
MPLSFPYGYRLSVWDTADPLDDPRWCHPLNIPRNQQTALSCFFSGHIKSLTFQHDRKVFPECHRCETDQASPSHILSCLGFTTDEVLGNPILFLDFLAIFGIKKIV